MYQLLIGMSIKTRRSDANNLIIYQVAKYQTKILIFTGNVHFRRAFRPPFPATGRNRRGILPPSPGGGTKSPRHFARQEMGGIWRAFLTGDISPIGDACTVTAPPIRMQEIHNSMLQWCPQFSIFL